MTLVADILGKRSRNESFHPLFAPPRVRSWKMLSSISTTSIGHGDRSDSEHPTDARHVLQQFTDYSHLRINKKESDEMAVTLSNNLDIKRRAIPQWQVCNALAGVFRCLHHGFHAAVGGKTAMTQHARRLFDRPWAYCTRRPTIDQKGGIGINALSMLFTPYIGHADQALIQHLPVLDLKLSTYRHTRYSGLLLYRAERWNGGIKAPLLAEVRVTIIDSNQSHHSSTTLDQPV